MFDRDLWLLRDVSFSYRLILGFLMAHKNQQEIQKTDQLSLKLMAECQYLLSYYRHRVLTRKYVLVLAPDSNFQF